jgi:uncharacterized protein HemY
MNDAIWLAKSLAEGEMRLVKLRRLKAPPAVIRSALELIGERMAALSENRLAEKLLPQVRKSVAISNERLDHLNNKTLIGRLYQEVNEWCIETDCFLDFPVEEPRTPEQEMDVLERSIRTNDQASIVGALIAIFDFVMLDLTFAEQELPPLPPKLDLTGIDGAT